MLPNDENFQIVIHKLSLNLAKVFYLKCWTTFIYKIWIIKILNGENSKKKKKKTLPKNENFQIEKLQSPLSISQRVSFEMLIFYKFQRLQFFKFQRLQFK